MNKYSIDSLIPTILAIQWPWYELIIVCDDSCYCQNQRPWRLTCSSSIASVRPAHGPRIIPPMYRGPSHAIRPTLASHRRCRGPSHAIRPTLASHRRWRGPSHADRPTLASYRRCRDHRMLTAPPSHHPADVWTVPQDNCHSQFA